MARWNTLRWPLGASALAAMAITGCGSAANEQGNRLHAAAETRLLTLVSRARTDVAIHNGAAAHKLLVKFVSDVGTLQTSGQLSRTTAKGLDSEAHAAAAQIRERLPAPTTNHLVRTVTSPTTTASPQDPPPASTTPAPPPAKKMRPGADATPPIAIPLTTDSGAKIHVHPGPGHGGGLVGEANHHFPHGWHDHHSGDGNAWTGDKHD